MREFNENEIDILIQVAKEKDDFHVELRKGVSQRKYVFEVEKDSLYFCHHEYVEKPAPDELVGLWIMAFADDLSYKHLQECIKHAQWQKCEKVEVVSYEYKVLS